MSDDIGVSAPWAPRLLTITVNPWGGDVIPRHEVLLLGHVSESPTPDEAAQVFAWSRRWLREGPNGPVRSLDVRPIDGARWSWTDEDRFWAIAHAVRSDRPPEPVGGGR